MKSVVFKAVNEARQVLINEKDKGFLLHVPIGMINDLGKDAPDNVVLVSTSGEYSGQGYDNGIITGFSYDPAIVDVVEILDPAIMSKNALQKAYNKVKNNSNAFLMLFLDGLSNGEESVMSTLYFMDDRFKVIGGSTGDDLQFKETFIYIGSQKVKHVALFFDMKKRTQLIKENIYEPYGDRLLVTEADPINRVVYKINNQPATTEYARLLGVSESQLPHEFMNHPLGKIYENDIFIASPRVVNSDKSISFYCQVMPNTFVYMLNPVDPVQTVNKTLSQLDFKPQFMYVVNCILRSLKFQEEGLWRSVDSCITGSCKNTTGFISYGEQFYKNHANQTMVILAVE